MKKKRIVIDRDDLKEKGRAIYTKSKDTINANIWIELLFMVAVALFVSAMVFLLVSHFIYSTNMGIREHITYEEGRNYVQEMLLAETAHLNDIGNAENSSTYQSEDSIFEEEFNTGQDVIENNISSKNEDSKEYVSQQIKSIIDYTSFDPNYVSDTLTYLVDGSGKLMYSDGIVESLDLIKVIQKANNNQYGYESDKFVAIYPVIISNQVCYLYNESTLMPFYYKEFTDIGNILGAITAVGIFILIIFRLTRNRIAYLEYLSVCLGEISKGNLDYEIEVIGEDELAQVAKSITHMEKELKYQIDAKIKTEKSKNELVTNVAHDLRTPLTSIIGYIGLVKNKGYRTEEEANKYLEIAYNKSEKLKDIIEDLFELTKLHQNGVQLNKSNVSLSNLINQLTEELTPLANERQIEIESYIDTNQTSMDVDITKMTRVFENLIENAIKYCPEKETVYVELKSMKKHIYVAVSNPAEGITEEEISRFFERFYRADQSRNSSAGGSGLGLAIAKNIVELHGGVIKAELNKDLICFKVILPRK